MSRQRVKQSASSVIASIQRIPKSSSDATVSVAGKVVSSSKDALNSVGRGAEWILNSTQGVLASSLSGDLNSLLHHMVKGPATIYDKAMDAEYIATHIGGGSHRMFDGGHTLLGAFQAVREASPHDTVVQEAMGLLESLFRDMTTPKGLPLVNWDKANYDQIAGFLNEQFGISKSWFYDLNSYDAAEIIGSSIGAIAIALNWNKADTEKFASLVGGMGVPALLGANPILIVVTVVALARAFHKAHQTGEYAELIDGGLKGGIGSGATLAAVSAVGVLGGPAGLGLLVGMTTGILVQKATSKLSVAQIGEFVAEQANWAAVEVQTLVKRAPATHSSI